MKDDINKDDEDIFYSMDQIGKSIEDSLAKFEKKEIEKQEKEYFDNLAKSVSYYIDKLIENGTTDKDTLLKLVYLEFYHY